MTTGETGEENQAPDSTRTALNEALKMFGEFSRTAAWRQLETDFHITRSGTRPLTRKEIEFALGQIFGRGADLVMKAFDTELAKLG
ncbi:MAG: hypothetical protein ABI361_08230 [Nitrososphaera sp.]